MSGAEQHGEPPSSGRSTPSARSRLEAMSREELQQRCRTLLSIAQRAKQARDEAVSEAESLRIKLASIDSNDFPTILAKTKQERDAANNEIARLKQELRNTEEKISDICDKRIPQTSTDLQSTAKDERWEHCASSDPMRRTGDAVTPGRNPVADVDSSDGCGGQSSEDRNPIADVDSSEECGGRSSGDQTGGVDRSSSDPAAAASREATIHRVEIDVHSQLAECRSSLARAQTDHDDLLQRHNAVLAEMNTMNELLRSRGETVARLSKELTTARASVSADRTEVCSTQSNVLPGDICGSGGHTEPDQGDVTSLRLNLRSSAARVSELESECSNLRKKLEGKLTDDQTEVMSCSTVLSRAEDASRMLEVDESIEDRYQRLKQLAVKFKRKLSAVNSELQSERQEKVSMSKQLTAANKDLTALRSHAKNIQALQLSHDQMQDRMDEACSRADQSNHQLDQAAIRISQLSQCVADITESRDTNRKHAKSLEESLAAAEKRANEVSTDYEQMKVTLAALEAKLHETAEKSSVLQNRVNQLESSSETAAVDMERLQQLDNSCEKLQHQLNEAVSACHVITNEKQQLSDELDSERRQYQEVSLRLHETTADRDQLSERLVDAEKSCSLAQQNAECLTQERERLTEELAGIAEKYNRTTHTESALKIENQKLHDCVYQLKKSISSLEDEIGVTKREFSQYKIRAQTVLKSAKEVVSKDRVRDEAEQREEVERARAEAVARGEEVIRVLRQQLHENKLEVTAMGEESSRLQVELARQREGVQQLKSQYQLSEQQYRHQVEQARAELTREQVKFQKETAELTHKIDIITSTKQSDESAVISELGKQVDELKEQLDRKCRELRELNQELATPVHASSPIDFCSMEREAAEGSERVTPVQTPIPTSMTTPMSLEKLLSAPLEDTSDNVSVSRFSVAGTDLGDRNQLCQELETQRRQLSHLAALLHESETSNVRLTQLCDTLKEEIRRLERSVERAKHLEQLEYLKNVTIKFVTLTERDERARLLPVLSTLLNLSPAETASLHSVIHGTSSSGKDEVGWSSYLHLWSGGPR